MTSQRIAQTNQQQNSETLQGSGILQRAAVRTVSDSGVLLNDQEVQPYSNTVFSKTLSQVPISTTHPQPIQAKLTIGTVGDKYEQEADRVAAQVVQRINAPTSVRSDNEKTVQRQDKGEKKTEVKQMMSPILQRRDSDAGMPATPDLEASINRARGGGQPLASNIRRRMEQEFGTDFSMVNIHTDSQSDNLNKSIQAKAFTTGQDVFFSQGEYRPGSLGGQALIAHELTHVVQQGRTHASTRSRIQRTPRDNESRMVKSLGPDGRLSAEDRADLIKLMRKPQSYAEAREIAEAVERESTDLLALVPAQLREDVREAINNYVADSSQINREARALDSAAPPPLAESALGRLITALDTLSQSMHAGVAVPNRIVYRAVKYKDINEIPYGRATTGSPSIQVGDYIRDRSVLSTSEHRQFLLGTEYKKQPGAMLKLAIMGVSGVPIAMDVDHAYNNAKAEVYYDSKEARRSILQRWFRSLFGPGARAGQAEVLFPRQTLFEVTEIHRGEKDVSVVLEEETITPYLAVTKHPFTGVQDGVV